MFATDTYFSTLETTYIGRDFHYFDTLSSTNNHIWKLNCANPNHGLCVLTESQTKGRGRRDNVWDSVPNKSLTFSFSINPEFRPEQFGLVSLLAGISIVKSLQECIHVHAELKWPNDVLIHGKKLGGILTESRRIEGKYKIVIGVGLNVNEKEMSKSIKKTATSLKQITNNHISREALLATIFNHFESDLTLSPEDVCHEWISFCAHQKQTVSFHVEDKIIQGTFEGITNNGFALINERGNTNTYSAGVIEL